LLQSYYIKQADFPGFFPGSSASPTLDPGRAMRVFSSSIAREYGSDPTICSPAGSQPFVHDKERLGYPAPAKKATSPDGSGLDLDFFWTPLARTGGP
jgi:hypothetical protein